MNTGTWKASFTSPNTSLMTGGMDAAERDYVPNAKKLIRKNAQNDRFCWCLLHSSSSKPQTAANKRNKIMESGSGVMLKSRPLMLNRQSHDLRLINEDGTPTTNAQNASIHMSAAHPIGLIPVPRGTARNGIQNAITSPLLPMPQASAIFPARGSF